MSGEHKYGHLLSVAGGLGDPELQGLGRAEPWRPRPHSVTGPPPARAASQWGDEARPHTRTAISGSPRAPLHLQDRLVGKLRAWTPAQVW